MGEGPLRGLRVVDCSLGFAGPRATGILADYGADVIWVEPPGGDPYRSLRPAAVSAFNRGKRSIILDISDTGHRRHLSDLLATADVFVHTWTAASVRTWGLDADSVRAAHPTLVYATVTSFGATDPRNGVPAREALVQALVGTMAEQSGFRDGPIFEGLPFAGIGASYLLVIAVLAALHRRGQDGHGREVETSLCDGALAYLSMLWGQSESAPGGMPRPGGARIVSRSFVCADDAYLGIHTGAVGAFGRLMQVTGLDDRVPPSADGLDLGQPLTPEQQRVLEDELPKIIASRPRRVWVELLRDADVCAVEHLAVGEVFDQPQPRHNEMVVRIDDPVLGPVEQVAPAAKFRSTPGAVRGPAPQAGADTATVLDELGTAHGWPTPPPAAARDTRPLLAGVKVLDLGAFYAGPYSSRLLADLGADVIKVEPTAGDPLRGMERPFFSAQAGKRALAANLKHAELALAVDALVRWADVVHHNMRPGAAERLGVGYDQVRAINPGVTYLYAPGWGSSGPDMLRQSFAPMMSGYVGIGFECAGRFNPPLWPTGNEDPGNGLLGAVAILLGLLHRQRTGAGQYVENPQLNATMAHMAHAVRVDGGEVLGAGRLDPMQYGVSPYERLYETGDGWLCIVADTDAERTRLLQAAGVELGSPVPDEDEVAARIAAAFGAAKTVELLDDLDRRGVPAVVPTGPNMATLLADPDHRRLGRVVECAASSKGWVREIGILVRVSEAEVPPHRPAPALGEHSDEVLHLAGYDDGTIRRLRAAGAVR